METLLKHCGLIHGLKKTVFKSGIYLFYAKGISLGDVIETVELEGVKYFKRILRKSGHSTYRFFLGENTSNEIFNKFWLPLEKIGCVFEKGFNRFYSVDIPEETDIYEAYSLFQEGEKNGVWEFEEGDVGHKLK